MLSRTPISKQLVKSWARLNSMKVVASSQSLQSLVTTTSSAQLHTEVGKKKMYGIHHEDGGHDYLHDHNKHGDHSGRQQNHIWSAEEINDQLKTLYRHKPETLSDKFMNTIVSSSTPFLHTLHVSNSPELWP